MANISHNNYPQNAPFIVHKFDLKEGNITYGTIAYVRLTNVLSDNTDRILLQTIRKIFPDAQAQIPMMFHNNSRQRGTLKNWLSHNKKKALLPTSVNIYKTIDISQTQGEVTSCFDFTLKAFCTTRANQRYIKSSIVFDNVALSLQDWAVFVQSVQDSVCHLDDFLH